MKMVFVLESKPSREKGGSKMKKTKWIVAALIAILIIASAVKIGAQSQSVDPQKKFYETCLSEKIFKHQAKTILKNSKSKNLRLDAETAAQKATFLNQNSNMLVEEMIEQDIDLKRYQIDFYLNKRFYELRD
jgi:hypothetical protein